MFCNMVTLVDCGNAWIAEGNASNHGGGEGRNGHSDGCNQQRNGQKFD